MIKRATILGILLTWNMFIRGGDGYPGNPKIVARLITSSYYHRARENNIVFYGTKKSFHTIPRNCQANELFLWWFFNNIYFVNKN